MVNEITTSWIVVKHKSSHSVLIWHNSKFLRLLAIVRKGASVSNEAKNSGFIGISSFWEGRKQLITTIHGRAEATWNSTKRGRRCSSKVKTVTTSMLHPKSFTKTCHEHHTCVLMHVLKWVDNALQLKRSTKMRNESCSTIRTVNKYGCKLIFIEQKCYGTLLWRVNKVWSTNFEDDNEILGIKKEYC